jgi:hypothetical protein
MTLCLPECNMRSNMLNKDGARASIVPTRAKIPPLLIADRLPLVFGGNIAYRCLIWNVEDDYDCGDHATTNFHPGVSTEAMWIGTCRLDKLGEATERGHHCTARLGALDGLVYVVTGHQTLVLAGPQESIELEIFLLLACQIMLYLSLHAQTCISSKFAVQSIHVIYPLVVIPNPEAVPIFIQESAVVVVLNRWDRADPPCEELRCNGGGDTFTLAAGLEQFVGKEEVLADGGLLCDIAG